MAERFDNDSHPVMITPGVRARRWFGPVTVSSGHYMVMGDNRDLSKDSRYFGFVPREEIVGRVFGVAGSLDINNWYLPRWQRFFSSIP